MRSTPLRRTFVRLLGLAAAVLLLVALVDVFIKTDEEKIADRIRDVCAALEARDAGAVCASLDPEFACRGSLGPLRYEPGDRAGFEQQLGRLLARCQHVRADVDELLILEADSAEPSRRTAEVRGFLRFDQAEARVPITYGVTLDFVHREGTWNLLTVRSVQLDFGVF